MLRKSFDDRKYVRKLDRSIKIKIMQNDKEFDYFESFCAKALAKIDDVNRKFYLTNDEPLSDESEEEEEQMQTDVFGEIDSCIGNLLSFPVIPAGSEDESYNPLMIQDFESMRNYLVDFLRAKETEPSYDILIESESIIFLINLFTEINEPEIEEYILDIIQWFLFRQTDDVLEIADNPSFFQKIVGLMDSSERGLQKKAQYVLCSAISLNGALETIPYEFFEEAINHFTNAGFSAWFCRIIASKTAVKKSFLPVLTEKVSSAICAMQQKKSLVQNDFSSFQSDAIFALKCILQQYDASEESNAALAILINESVIDTLVECRFDESLSSSVFIILLKLLSREIQTDAIIDKSLGDLPIRLNGIASKEREQTLYYALKVLDYGFFVPTAEIYSIVYKLINEGMSLEKEFGYAFMFCAVANELIPPFKADKRVDVEEEEEEEEFEPLYIDNMPFDIVEGALELLSQCTIASDTEEMILSGLDVLLFARHDFVENIIDDDSLEESVLEIIEIKNKEIKNEEVLKHVHNIASTITRVKEEMSDGD